MDRRQLLMLGSVASLFPTPAMADAARDRAVLETVFLDLIERKDAHLEPPRPEKLYISTEVPRYRFWSPILRPEHIPQWKELSPKSRTALEEAGQDLMSRFGAKDPQPPLQLPNARFVLLGPAAEKALYVERKGGAFFPQVFRAYRPGYSKDDRFAVVHLVYPWSRGFHAADATYGLEKRGEQWVVRFRQFMIYP